MGRIRLLMQLANPWVLALLCLLTGAGSLLSPHLFSPGFPPTRLSGILPLSPQAWSVLHLAGAMLVTALLWTGVALVTRLGDQTDGPSGVSLPVWLIGPRRLLRWALGLQVAAFALVLIVGNGPALFLCLLGAGLGNAYSLPPVRLKRFGLLSYGIAGGGVVLCMTGGMMAQAGVTEVGLLSALGLGLAGAAASVAPGFATVERDRANGVTTLPVLLGPHRAAWVAMAATAATSVLALFMLVQSIGIQEGVVSLFLLPVSGQLYLVLRLASRPDPALGRLAGMLTSLFFLATVAVYVGALRF